MLLFYGVWKHYILLSLPAYLCAFHQHFGCVPQRECEPYGGKKDTAQFWFWYSTFKAVSVFRCTFVLQPIKQRLTLTWYKEAGSITSRCKQWQCLCSHIQPWEILHQIQKHHNAQPRMPCSVLLRCFTSLSACGVFVCQQVEIMAGLSSTTRPVRSE